MTVHIPSTLILLIALSAVSEVTAADQRFLAGAHAIDVTPTSFPVIVNGGFLAKSGEKTHGRLHMRWLVLDDGGTRIALGVLDSCMIPGEFADTVKAGAAKLTGIPADRIMLSATHTHSAPSLMQLLGTPPDPAYRAFALPLIIEGLERAVRNLAPARIGWTVVPAPKHTHTRVWIRRPDRMLTDPFGEVSVRAMMHPGHQSPDAIGPSGPSDPALTLIAVQSPDRRPIAVLANYSMHYFGAPAVSADYFGAFADKIGPLVGATDPASGFVGIMSQGTSGDQHWMDYRGPRRTISMDGYAGELARIAADAYQSVVFRDWAPLAMRGRTLRIATRQPDAKRLVWAQGVVTAMGDRLPKDRSEVYAREQLWQKENPTREVKLQAVRIGELGIATWPLEVFALSGLKIKAQSPLQPTMNIELANGAEGYIPPPEVYPLGGYNTWACRSAGLEEEAEPKIVEALLGLLESVSGQARRQVEATPDTYARAVLAAKPFAYWRMNEWSGPTALDAAGTNRHGTYDPGVARWLDGFTPAATLGVDANHRAPHFAGTGMKADVRQLGGNYALSFWLWNGLDPTARATTGIAFARGGERLGITGTSAEPGRLFFAASPGALPLAGKTELRFKDWHHVALVREGYRVAVYLDGKPEISGAAGGLAAGATVFLAGRPEDGFTFEGKLDEAAVFDRALTPLEIAAQYDVGARQSREAAATPSGLPATAGKVR